MIIGCQHLEKSNVHSAYEQLQDIIDDFKTGTRQVVQLRGDDDLENQFTTTVADWDVSCHQCASIDTETWFELFGDKQRVKKISEAFNRRKSRLIKGLKKQSHPLE